MKAQILKIAGVKSEKEFYKKYPSEEAFMKVHGKAFKKAQTSDAVEKAQFGNQFSPNYYQANQPYGISSTPGAAFNPGNTNIPAGGIGAPNAQAFANQSFQTQDPFALNNKVGKQFATANPLPAGVTDKSVPDSIGFTPQYPAQGGGLGSFTDMIPGIGAVVGAITSFTDEKNAVKQARQDKALSDLQVRAAGTRAEPIERKYVRPEDALVSPNQMFPTQGVGTNVLKRNGGFIDKAQNGYVAEEKSDLINKYPNAARQKAAIENRKSNQVAFGPQEAPAGYVAPKETETIKAISKPKSKEVWKIWEDTTGTPWSEAKKKGYTDGSAKNNLALADKLLRGEKLTPPSGSKSSSKPQAGKQQTYSQAMASKPKMGKKDFGNIQDPEEGNFITRTGEVLANPLQSYAHYTKYGELPAEGFSKNNKNAYDEVLGAINPAYWVNSAANAIDYGIEGEYGRAGMEALGALPAAGLLKSTKYLPYLKGLPGARNYQRAAKQIGEGALRLGEGAPKQLGARTIKQLGPGAMKQIGRGAHPNFVMYEDGGEIQNTYDPGNLYNDLGYEPLNDSEEVKAYAYGGYLPQAQSGFSDFMSAGGGDLANQFVGSAFPNSAGQQIGSSIGNLIPIPGAGAVLGLAGGLLDQNPKEIQRLQRQTAKNQENIILNQTLPSIQAGYASHMENGGWVSHDWQPQVITQFGDHSMKKLLAPDKTMDTLRSGGHISGRYVQPSPSALETMALGGQVKTTWGGHAETISQNPYMPGTGETIMFRGKSHDESDGNGHTGIGVKYGEGGHDSYTDYAEYGSQNADADVEVERNEPAFEMMDPETGEKNLTVLGNLKFDKRIAAQTGDQDIIALSNKYNGKKFKNIGDIISKQEAKENKVIASSTAKLDSLDVNNSFDKLTLAALTANIQGANAKLKGYAADKTNLATFQNAINDASEEHYLDADHLAQGKGKVNKEALGEAKYGTKLEKAQNGKYKVQGKGKKWAYTPAGETGVPEFDDPGLYVTQWGKSIDDALADKDRADQMIKYLENAPGPEGQKVRDALAEKKTRDEKIKFIKEQSTNSQVGPMHYVVRAARDVTMPKKQPVTTGETTTAASTDNEYETIPYERNKWVDILGQALPFFRPTDQEGLDPRQLSGEMYALTNNQVDPVKVQTYQPDLSSPYDISLQDQMNEITAQTRAAQRMAQGNPEAQAIIAANAYDAINKVKGEEFRANQAMKDKVYGENRNTLNQAKLQNLAAYDQQYQRQSQAVSNTKEATQAALNSIADKYGKNKLENRTLGVYENMYNYRYDNAGRAINMNAPQQFNMPIIYGPNGEITHVAQKDEKGNIVGYTEVKKKGGAAATTAAQTKTTPVIPTNNTPATTSPTTTLYSPIKINYDDPLAPLPGKNGKKLKLAAKNGSIVRAIKNL